MTVKTKNIKYLARFVLEAVAYFLPLLTVGVQIQNKNHNFKTDLQSKQARPPHMTDCCNTIFLI